MSSTQHTLFGTLLLSLATTAHAATPPDYGYQWATITHANNPAYPGPIIEPEFEDSLVGRGSPTRCR